MAKRNVGRPPLSDTEETVIIKARVKKSQGVKFIKLGGSQWVWDQKDKAKLRGKK